MSKIINQIKPANTAELYLIQDYDIANNNVFTIKGSLMNSTAKAVGVNAISLGEEASAADNSIAIGPEATAAAQACAIGINTQAGEAGAVALGVDAQAQLSGSVAIGEGTRATTAHQVVLGQYNDTNNGALFILGNGLNDNERNNIFSITSSKMNFNNNFIFTSSDENESNGLCFNSNGIISYNSKDILDLSKYTLCLGGQINKNAEDQKGYSVAVNGTACGTNSFAFGENANAGENQFIINMPTLAEVNNPTMIFAVGHGQKNIMKITTEGMNVSGTIVCSSPVRGETRALRNIIVSQTPPTTLSNAQIGDIYLWYSKTEEIATNPEETQNEAEV